MVVQLDEMISAISFLLEKNKGLRNKVLLEKALGLLKEYKKLNEKKII